MKEKNLKNIKNLIKKRKSALLIILLILICDQVNAQNHLTYSDFDNFYRESLNDYNYPEISIPEFETLSNVNEINFPKISADLSADLIILLYNIHSRTNIDIYLKHEQASLESNLISSAKDIANYRLRFIEFLILSKTNSHE